MQKIFGAGLIASTVLTAGMPVFAAEGDGARVSIFGSTAQSTPFTVQENREDPLYSPYSAYGNGEAAVYKKGGKDEEEAESESEEDLSLESLESSFLSESEFKIGIFCMALFVLEEK